MRRCLVFILAILCVSSPVRAADEKASPELTHAQIDEIGRSAHAMLGKAKLSDGNLIGEEKAKSLDYPLVPYDVMEFVILRGSIAGFAAHCDLDWQKKYYLPMMQALRAEYRNYDDYQWAFVSMLHGASMTSATRDVEGEACEPKMKENLEKAALK